MARKKSPKILNVFKIFFSSIKTYFLYLDKTSKHLFFPIFGQVLGVSFIFAITYNFTINAEQIQSIAPFFDNERNMLITLFVILSPFFLVFFKAFFEYIVAFCSLNLLFYTVANKKRVQNIDLQANNGIIIRKLFQYILLLFLVTLLVLIPIVGIFLCLAFQVFSFENDTNFWKSVSRSIELVKENVFPTILMLILCFSLTYLFLPELIIWALEKIPVMSFITSTIEPWTTLLPIDVCNDILSVADLSINQTEIAQLLSKSIISFIVIGFTLPFRCCCFTELYKLYDSAKIKEFSGETEEIIKRATDKKGKN